jgi:hypothetical protein
VNVQVFVLLPPLEQARDQMTSRSFVALSVIAVPIGKNAEPLLPTATLIPAGVDVTRSPPRPIAVTMKAEMRRHLTLTTQETVARLQGIWTADVAAYDKIHQHILHMSDVLADGAVKQFPQRFC